MNEPIDIPAETPYEKYMEQSRTGCMTISEDDLCMGVDYQRVIMLNIDPVLDRELVPNVGYTVFGRVATRCGSRLAIPVYAYPMEFAAAVLLHLKTKNYNIYHIPAKRDAEVVWIGAYKAIEAVAAQPQPTIV